MTPTATLASIVVCCLGSGAGFATAIGMPPQGAGDLPWKEIAGGSAAVLMLGAIVVFLRFLQQDRAARDVEREADRKARDSERIARDVEREKDREHVEQIVAKFGDTTTKLAADAAATHTNLATQLRDESQAARRELQDLVRDLRRPTP